MKSPEIYITGVGFSGTTFVTKMARELSLDIGTDLSGREGEEEVKGLEWTPFRDISLRSGLFMGRAKEPDIPRWTSIMIENIPRIQREFSNGFELDYPQVIKCPEYGQSFFLDIFKPKHVIVCYRDLVSTAISLKNGHGGAFINLTIQEIYVALMELF